MAKKEFANLVKPMIIKAPPKGLYPEPRIWMEGKDLEGFDAHFSFGFIKKPTGPFHPLEGAIVHPYDELLVFETGGNTKNILEFDAEISVELGEEREEYVFTQPTVVLVPKGTPHGTVKVRKLGKPIVHYSIGLAAAYKASPTKVGAAVSKGKKYAKYIKKMITAVDPKAIGSGMGYESVIGRDGIMRPAKFGVGPGNGDEIVWLYGPDLEGFKVNFTWGLYSQCGKWHRGGESHYHPEAEILCFVGLDPDKPDYLGAELELGMGKDLERHVFNTPTCVVCPGGFPHLPLITRWVDKPYGFFVACLSGEHASPWVETKG
ncbi:MAG: hypothetical protein ABR886_10550 [Dehalococcoidales bacterium]|jgi:hypothetical protein